jgi:hypothetical protein
MVIRGYFWSDGNGHWDTFALHFRLRAHTFPFLSTLVPPFSPSFQHTLATFLALIDSKSIKHFDFRLVSGFELLLSCLKFGIQINSKLESQSTFLRHLSIQHNSTTKSSKHKRTTDNEAGYSELSNGRIRNSIRRDDFLGEAHSNADSGRHTFSISTNSTSMTSLSLPAPFPISTKRFGTFWTDSNLA